MEKRDFGWHNVFLFRNTVCLFKFFLYLCQYSCIPFFMEAVHIFVCLFLSTLCSFILLWVWFPYEVLTSVGTKGSGSYWLLYVVLTSSLFTEFSLLVHKSFSLFCSWIFYSYCLQTVIVGLSFSILIANHQSVLHFMPFDVSLGISTFYP